MSIHVFVIPIQSQSRHITVGFLIFLWLMFAHICPSMSYFREREREGRERKRRKEERCQGREWGKEEEERGEGRRKAGADVGE